MARHRYRIYGLVVESELLLSSVERCENDDRPAISIVFGTDDAFEARASGLREDCEEWIRYTTLADGGLFVRINHVFEAIVEADGRRVVCARVGEVDDRTFEANLVNFALSASLTLQGEECLHATVVELDGCGVALIGPSGAGKSTLASFLLGAGAALITDDMLRVTFVGDKVLAHPGPYRLKLFEDAARRFLPMAIADGELNRLSRKTMFRPGAPPRRSPVPLAALIWLGEAEPEQGAPAASARRLAGIERVKTLTRATMNTRYFAPERLGRQLQFAERVARALPIYALAYRRDYASLEEVLRELRAVLGT